MMIRKAGLFLLIVVPLVVLVSLYVARNLIVAGVAALALERMVGSEVSIEGVSLEPLEMRAGFERLRISDREVPGQAMLVAGPARFDLNGLQLFAGKIIVDDLSVEGLTFGQPCADCRPLPQPPPPPPPPPGAAGEPGAADEAEDGGWNISVPLPELDLSALSQELDVDRVTQGQNLASTQKVAQAQTEGQERMAALQQRQGQLDADNRLAAIRARVDRLDFSSKDPRKLREATDGLKAAADQTKSLRGEVQALSADVKAEPQRLQEALAQANASLEEDVAAAMQLARLGDLNTEQVGSLLFGQAVLERFNWVLGQVGAVRGMLGSDADAPVEPPRRAGNLVAFPVTGRAYPGFLVQRIGFTGSGIEGADGKPLQYSGKLTGLSSNARVYGEPMRLDATADGSKGESWVVTGSFDHRASPGVDTIVARGSGVSLSDFKLGGGSLPERASSTDADVTLETTIRGNQLDATLRVDANGMQFHFAEGLPNDGTQRAIRDMFRGITTMELQARLTGTLRKPRVGISTSMDAAFSQQMRGLLGARRAEAEARVRDQLQQRLTARQGEARQSLDGPRGELEGQLRQTEAQVQAAQAELTQRQAGIGQAAKAKEDAARAEAKAKEDAARAAAKAKEDAAKRKATEEAKKRLRR